MKKSKSLKKLSLKKLTISKLTSANKIQGGSGICGPKSERPYICPPEETCHITACRSCSPVSDQVNGC